MESQRCICWSQRVLPLFFVFPPELLVFFSVARHDSISTTTGNNLSLELFCFWFLCNQVGYSWHLQVVLGTCYMLSRSSLPLNMEDHILARNRAGNQQQWSNTTRTSAVPIWSRAPSPSEYKMLPKGARCSPMLTIFSNIWLSLDSWYMDRDPCKYNRRKFSWETSDIRTRSQSQEW